MPNLATKESNWLIKPDDNEILDGLKRLNEEWGGLLSPARASAELGVSRESVSRLMQRNTIRHVRAGKFGTFVALADVEARRQGFKAPAGRPAWKKLTE
jgi:hypothetical protein